MTEEKPQKADLRAKIFLLKEQVGYYERGIYDEKTTQGYIDACNDVLALIDADSKAREEEKKRLADELEKKIMDRVGKEVINGRMSSKQMASLNADIHWMLIDELTASKQDSEGTG